MKVITQNKTLSKDDKQKVIKENLEMGVFVCCDDPLDKALKEIEEQNKKDEGLK